MQCLIICVMTVTEHRRNYPICVYNTPYHLVTCIHVTYFKHTNHIRTYTFVKTIHLASGEK